MYLTDLADIKLKFTAFITLQKEILLPHTQMLREADILLAEVSSLLQSEGRKVGYGIFRGQIHKHPDIKEQRERRLVPVPFPVDLAELTPLEQNCKKSRTLL